MASSNKIYFSSKNYPELSNFYPSELLIDGIKYYHVEGFFQASKAIGIDNDFAKRIADTKDPKECKKLGKSFNMSHSEVIEWDSIKKRQIMKKAITIKFLAHSDLLDKLLSTGDSELIEYAPWDEYWGSGRNGDGKNMLGHTLMLVRDIIRLYNQ